jgi:hypothetical protein
VFQDGSNGTKHNHHTGKDASERVAPDLTGALTPARARPGSQNISCSRRPRRALARWPPWNARVNAQTIDSQLRTRPWTGRQLAVVARGKSHGTSRAIRQHRCDTPQAGRTSASASKARVARRVPQTHGLFHSFTSEQFHALLNSLFKVLFNFPSRYLFAIGLACIFSLGWGLPPI